MYKNVDALLVSVANKIDRICPHIHEPTELALMAKSRKL